MLNNSPPSHLCARAAGQISSDKPGLTFYGIVVEVDLLYIALMEQQIKQLRPHYVLYYYLKIVSTRHLIYDMVT